MKSKLFNLYSENFKLESTCYCNPGKYYKKNYRTDKKTNFIIIISFISA